MKKSKTRLFITKQITSNLMIYIKDKQYHFLKNVLRVKINDKINIFDGISGEWESIIIGINRDNIVLKVSKNIRKIKKINDVWLIFAPIKPNRMNIAIQKATELGVSKIIPCITDFTNIRNIKIKSLQDNAIESAEQSERLEIPKVEKVVNLDSLISEWPDDRKLIFCDESIKEGKNIIDELKNNKGIDKKWAVIIGPEGGFSEKENNLITTNKNVIKVSLGNKLLRSDTAIAVSLFCIEHLVF